MQCVIPSLEYLNLTSLTPINPDNTIFIEVSNNGKDFSNSTKIFKFIPNDELLHAYPITGPEYGGTLINITIVDLPFANGSSGMPIP